SHTQFGQSPARHRVPPWCGCSPSRSTAIATESPARYGIGRPSTTMLPGPSAATASPPVTTRSSAHPGTGRIERRLELQASGSAVADDLDLELTGVWRGEVSGDVAEGDRDLAVVRVSARGDPTDHGAIVPDRFVADDVCGIVGIGFDDEGHEPPL